MSSTVLLVDAEQQVRAIIEQQLDPAQWTMVHAADVGRARSAIKEQEPALVVVNVDIAQGWPLCADLKRTHASIPVIVVSFRFGTEVFHNHQKLDTRADAYHRLPEEREGLEISLGYFSSHKSETGHDEEDSAPSRPRPRRTGPHAVPTGIVQRLEATVAEQARALEDARRQIEALEVERDAVAEKNRRQMLELMTVAPAPAGAGEAETAALKERLAALEAEVLLSSRREDENAELRAQLAARAAELERAQSQQEASGSESREALARLEEAKAQAERALQLAETQLATLRNDKAQLAARVAELEEAHRRALKEAGAQVDESLEAAREAARREANEAAEQLAQASEQLARLANELTMAHQLRTQADKERATLAERVSGLEQRLAQAQQRAEAAETAWSGLNARLEHMQATLASKSGELERLAGEKKTVEEALATSRRLMREYATDAARKAEELKGSSERLKELEAAAGTFATAKDELEQALAFEKSLVASLESDLATARAQPAASPGELEALRAELTSVRAEAEADLELVRTQARAELEELRAESATELEAQRSRAAAELEAARTQATADLEVALAANTDLETRKAELEQKIAALEARIGESEAAQARGKSEHAAEREALASHVATVHSRFEALVQYARALEARLVSAEGLRAATEAKLEGLVGELRAQTLSGEVPPAMELPSAPTEPRTEPTE